MQPNQFDPAEWKFLSPLVDPAFIAGSATPDDRIAKTFSSKNLNDTLNPFAAENKKFREETVLYNESATALGGAFAEFAKKANELRILMEQRGSAFNIMSGDGNSAVWGAFRKFREKYDAAEKTVGWASDLIEVAADVAEYTPVVSGALIAVRGVQDLMSLDLNEVKTIEERGQLEYAQRMVTTCLGSWSYLGILDFNEGVAFRGVTTSGSGSR
jgi:hypothetical protein